MIDASEKQKKKKESYMLKHFETQSKSENINQTIIGIQNDIM